MDERQIAAASVVVAALLVVVAFHPAAFTGLTDPTADYRTWVAPEDAAGYEDSINAVTDEEFRAEDLRVIAYDDLSPEARAIFDRTLSGSPGESGAYAYEMDVCWNYTPLCPGPTRSDLPPELAYDGVADPENGAVIVVRDGQRYLVATPAATSAHVDGRGIFLLVWRALAGATLLPLAAFLATYGTGAVRRSRSLSAGAAGTLAFAVATAIGGDLAEFRSALVALVTVPPLIAPGDDDLERRTIALKVGIAAALVPVVCSYAITYLDVGALRAIGVLLAGGLSLLGVLSISAAGWIERLSEREPSE